MYLQSDSTAVYFVPIFLLVSVVKTDCNRAGFHLHLTGSHGGPEAIVMLMFTIFYILYYTILYYIHNVMLFLSPHIINLISSWGGQRKKRDTQIERHDLNTTLHSCTEL